MFNNAIPNKEGFTFLYIWMLCVWTGTSNTWMHENVRSEVAGKENDSIRKRSRERDNGLGV